MTTIQINPTTTTPGVYFDSTKGKLELIGRSSPENSVQFYQPIRSALSSTVESEKLEVMIKMEYFNTSSSKCIYDLFKEIRNLQSSGKDINVQWYYESEDPDMLEAGEDYSEVLDIPFIFVEYMLDY